MEYKDYYKIMGVAREAMKQVCVDRMVAFGQAGHAGRIKPATCKEMACCC